MGFYTSFVIHPVDKNWRPDDIFLNKVLCYFNNSSCQQIWGYDKPLYWDNDPDEIFEEDEVDIDRAINLFNDMRLKAIIFFIESDWFSDKICDEIEDQDIVECYKGFIPCWISVSTGKRSIPDYEQEGTYAEFQFAIFIGKDGMPEDVPKYLEKVFAPSKTIQELMAFLKSEVNIEWTISCDCAY